MNADRVAQPGPLLAWLTGTLGNRTRAKQALRLGRVRVNGDAVDRHDHPLAAGDQVTLGPPRDLPQPSQLAGLPLVHEDAAILVIDKPVGLLTMATDAERERTAYHRLTEYVRQSPRGGRVFIVHRLDRETSGLLVFARTESAKRQLQNHWGDVVKRYAAVVEGVPPEPTGTIQSHLTESGVHRVFSGPETPRSKRAVTRYALVKTVGTRSLLEVDIDTGRKHQIRVHLADLGCPVVGDNKYGRGDPAPRLGLHAAGLRFRHPTSGEAMEFRSDLPAALADLVR